MDAMLSSLGQILTVNWPSHLPLGGLQVSGKTVGVVGTGKIGAEFCTLLKVGMAGGRLGCEGRHWWGREVGSPGQALLQLRPWPLPISDAQLSTCCAAGLWL